MWGGGIPSCLYDVFFVDDHFGRGGGPYWVQASTQTFIHSKHRLGQFLQNIIKQFHINLSKLRTRTDSLAHTPASNMHRPTPA